VNKIPLVVHPTLDTGNHDNICRCSTCNFSKGVEDEVMTCMHVVISSVMRTQGSLRLILNTKLWPQMQVDKASEKSVRITAMDTEDQGVKVFLITVDTMYTGPGIQGVPNNGTCHVHRPRGVMVFLMAVDTMYTGPGG